MPEPVGDPAPGSPTLPDRLLGFWASVGAPTRPGASAEALAAFDQRHAVRLGAAIRAYFSAVDGMEPGGRDDLFLRFVPLDEVVPSASQGGPASTYVIAEHRLAGFFYVVQLDADSAVADPVWLWDEDEVWPIASSFAAFLELYLNSPGKMFPVIEPSSVDPTNPVDFS